MGDLTYRSQTAVGAKPNREREVCVYTHIYKYVYIYICMYAHKLDSIQAATWNFSGFELGW